MSDSVPRSALAEPAATREGPTAAGLRRLWAMRGVAAVVLAAWWVCVGLSAWVPAATADRIGRELADGPAGIADPGGVVALEVLLRHRADLSWALSVALGATLAFVLFIEPLLRGAILCAAGRCGRGCPAKRGAFHRGLVHWPRLVWWRPLTWAAGAVVAAGLLAAGFPALVVLPATALAAGLFGDAGSATMVAAERTRQGLTLLGRLVRRHPAWLFAWGGIWRIAALVPSVLAAVSLARGPAEGPGRTIVAALLLSLGVLLRAWWYGALRVRVERLEEETTPDAPEPAVNPPPSPAPPPP